MGFLSWIRDRFAGLVPYGGTLSTPSPDDLHPIAFANELNGGLHGYRSLEELTKIPVQRLMVPMAAMVKEHVHTDGSVFPRAIVVFEPSDDDWNALQQYERLFDMPDYDLSAYWKVMDQSDVTAELETQFAPEVDYGLVSGPGAPAFRPPLISADNYQLGYKSDEDHTVIWVDVEDYDPLVHKYQRQRVGATGKWGIPVKILGESYTAGDYADNRFIWVPKNDVPTRPRSLVNGLPNNEPAGWAGTPEVPGGINYYTYIITHDLFQITAIKDAYQNLKSEWSLPLKISTDPQLVRYGNKPSSTNFINEDGSDTADWRGYYTPGVDTHMATRQDSLSPWRIQNIDHEDGEYVDYIFKAFPVGYETTEDDRPTIANPFSEDEDDYPNNGWKDSSFLPAQDQVLHYSTGRKYNNGDLKPSGWAIPTPANGEDIIQVVITPTTSTTFKYDAGGVVTPAEIQLVAKFYRGQDEIGLPFTVQWFKGAYAEENEIVAGETAGPSQYHEITGTKREVLTISPEAVDNTQLYTCRVFYTGEDFYDTITILDVSDSQGYLAVIESDDGFVYKNQEGSKTFTAKLYNNGAQVPNASCTFQWFRGSTDITPASNKHTVSVAGADFVSKEVLKVTITTQGLSFSRTETLVDLQDAKATIWQWTTQEATPTENTVWTTNPASAVWARISLDGGTTFGTPFKIKGESAPFNGGFYRTVYKNSVTQPVATGVSPTLFPTAPTGWTDVPTARGAGEHTWAVTAFFTKIPYNEDGTPNTNVALTNTNWQIQGAWGVAVRITGIDGDQEGPQGDIGAVGWSPELATVSRANDEVHQVVDWINLGDAPLETKPSTGYYIGVDGYVTDIAQAKNIRGRQGANGVFSPADFWATPVVRINGNIGSPNYESWDFRMRASKAGIVYFSGKTFRNGSGDRFVDFELSSSSFLSYMLPASRDFSAGASETVIVDFGAGHFVNGADGADFSRHAFIYRSGSSFFLRLVFVNDYTFVFNGSYMADAAIL